MTSLKVNLGERSYPIFIGEGLIKRGGNLIRPLTSASKIAIVANSKVLKLYGAGLKSSLKRAGFEVKVITIPDGERFKNLKYISMIYDGLIRNNFDRSSAILSLGGGVTGDMAGFAAATYMRGIDYFQFATTLLAQVDSSVGGKTGVDYPGGKNIIGAFYQPRGVISDLSSIKTLSDREYRCGLAEVIKYGVIRSASLFAFLEKSSMQVLSRKRGALERIVKESCKIKARIVAEDERESGVRAILNMGHTFGHGIETALNFKKIKHGEAVAIGLVLAAKLSYSLGLVSHKSVMRVEQLVSKFGLPLKVPSQLTPDKVYRGMMHDKKIVSGIQRFVLFDRIGNAFVRSGLTKREIIAIMQ